MMLVVSPSLVLQHVMVKVMDEGVGVGDKGIDGGNNTMGGNNNMINIGNGSVHICNITMNSGSICICIDCNFGLGANSQHLS